jgi:hypothetical protein
MPLGSGDLLGDFASTIAAAFVGGAFRFGLGAWTMVVGLARMLVADQGCSAAVLTC